MTASTKFYGKYRGTVVNNIDPMMIGRIQAIVPDVSTIALTSWAMPCFPVAGIQTGMYALPLIGSGVWIEFEKGDPDYPIWTGCFYGSAAEVPALAADRAAGAHRHHLPDAAAERPLHQRRAGPDSAASS